MSIYTHIILSLSVQIPLIFVMAFACGFDQNCMSLARLAPQPHLSVLDMQGVLPRPGLHVPATPPCSSLICSAVALEPDGSLPLVSACLLGYRWMKRPGRRSLVAEATLQVATNVATPPRIDPQIAATFSQTFFFCPSQQCNRSFLCWLHRNFSCQLNSGEQFVQQKVWQRSFVRCQLLHF